MSDAVLIGIISAIPSTLMVVLAYIADARGHRRLDASMDKLHLLMNGKAKETR